MSASHNYKRERLRLKRAVDGTSQHISFAYELSALDRRRFVGESKKINYLIPTALAAFAVSIQVDILCATSEMKET